MPKLPPREMTEDAPPQPDADAGVARREGLTGRNTPLPDEPQPKKDLARSAFEAMPLSAFLLDEQGFVLMHTRRAERQFGVILADHDGSGSSLHLSALTHLDSQTLRTTLRDALSVGRVNLPMLNLHKTQAPKIMPFHLSLMRSAEGHGPVYMLAQDQLKTGTDALRTANDIREREMERSSNLEAQVTAMQRALLSAESFSHAASHDLRSPINALLGLIDLFARKFGDDLPDTAHTYVDHMRRAAVQMDEMTEKLLTHARSAAAPLDLQRVDIQTVIDGVLSALDPSTRLNASSLVVEGPGFALMAEQTMLSIMLTNLVSNALKHGAPDRPLQIFVTTAVDGSTATVEVADTGTGFDPDKRETIFVPFQKLKSDVAGSGIGLATCAEICRRHGWTITAASDGLSGARFIISFPAVLPV